MFPTLYATFASRYTACFVMENIKGINLFKYQQI